MSSVKLKVILKSPSLSTSCFCPTLSRRRLTELSSAWVGSGASMAAALSPPTKSRAMVVKKSFMVCPLVEILLMHKTIKAP